MSSIPILATLMPRGSTCCFPAALLAPSLRARKLYPAFRMSTKRRTWLSIWSSSYIYIFYVCSYLTIDNFEYTQSAQACRLLRKKVLRRCRCPLGGVHRGPNMYSHSIMSSATDAHVKACSIPPQILGSSYAHEDPENTKTNNKNPTRNLMPMGRPLRGRALRARPFIPELLHFNFWTLGICWGANLGQEAKDPCCFVGPSADFGPPCWDPYVQTPGPGPQTN